MLIEADAEEETETIKGIVDEGFSEGLAESERRFENVVEVTGDSGVRE